MPTAVESIARLGAVLVQLPPSAAPALHVDPNGLQNLGGRSDIGTRALLAKTSHTATGPQLVSDGSDTLIPGRSGKGPVSMFNPHMPVVKPSIGTSHTHKTPVHHPAPAKLTPAHTVDTDYSPIGTRTGLGAAAIMKTSPKSNEAVDKSLLLPAVKPATPPGGPTGEAFLRPLLPAIGTALQGVIPPTQKTLEAIGIGTDEHTLAILIGLLRSQGYHVTIASCDGSVRQGFSGPTAILRAHSHNGLLPAVFVQQVGAARG